MKISIIIPAHNEEKRIERTLKEYLTFLRNKKLNFEIVVVLNGCKDNTLKIVSKYKAKDLKILEFKESGKGFAVIQGFKYALNSDLIGFVDADLATSPQAFYYLIENIKDYGGIIASRYVTGAKLNPKPTLQRIIVSRIYNLLIRTLFVMNYRDTQCGAKLFKANGIREIIDSLTVTRWAFDVDLLYQLKRRGYKIKEIPTTWSDKKYSTINFMRAGPMMALAMIRLRLMNSRFKFIVRGYDLLPNWIKLRI